MTSALHMYRALATFRSAGVRAIPSATDFEGVGEGRQTVLDWLPNAAALERTTRALKEYLGILAYALRGWIDWELLGEEPPRARVPAPLSVPGA